MITVQVANRRYQCNRQQADELIAKAGAAVKHGVYGIEHTGTGYVELFNLPMTTTQIKKMKREYKKRGVKVYANI